MRGKEIEMSKNDMPGEHSLFVIRGSLKKRIVTEAIFAFFMLMMFVGIYLRNIYKRSSRVPRL